MRLFPCLAARSPAWRDTAVLCLGLVFSGCGKDEAMRVTAEGPEEVEIPTVEIVEETGPARPPLGVPMPSPQSMMPDLPGTGGPSVMAPLGESPVLVQQARTIVKFPEKPKDAAPTWSRYRGPYYNGLSHETGLVSGFTRSGPKFLWRQRVGVGFSSLAVADGKVYTMGNGGDVDAVFCLDALTGEVVWRSGYPADLGSGRYEGGPSATPTVHEGRVYVLSKNGELLCLNGRTGKTVWMKNVTEHTGAKSPRYGFAGSPLVVDHQVIVNAGAAGCAFHKDTGELLWFTKGVGGYASPIPFQLGGRPAILLFGEQNILAVDPKGSGRGLWSHPWKTEENVNAADPVIVGDRIFVSSGYRAGCALFRLDDGKLRHIWHSRAISSHFNPAVVVGHYAYGFDGQAGDRAKDSLVCVSLGEGRRTWVRYGFGFGSLIGADGKLFVLTELGELIILEANPHAFTELGHARILGRRCWTSPALSDGLLYARNAGGRVVCVDLREKQPEVQELAQAERGKKSKPAN